MTQKKNIMKNLSHNILAATLILISAAVIGFGAACVTAPVKQGSTLKTFVEPSIQASAIKAVAILPIRNMQLLPDEIREFNRGITDGMSRQNPKLKLVGAVESVTLLNSADLADKYSQFLRDYNQSGIPDIKILNEIGKALGVDAILQGEVSSINQADGYLGVNGVQYYGKTGLSVRYILLSTANGTVLWEATGTAFKLSEKPKEPAPTLYEVIQLAQEKILSALPTLSQ